MKKKHKVTSGQTGPLDDPRLMIRIDGLPHLVIQRSKIIGWQTWVESKKWFCIEIYDERLHTPILLEYNKRELWIDVLKEIERNL